MVVDVLLDTSVCIEIMRSPAARKAFRDLIVANHWDCVAISTISRFELERGIRGRRGEGQARSTLTRFLDAVEVLHFQTEAALAAADVAMAARSRGCQLGNYDILIAAQAASLRVPLISSDAKLVVALAQISLGIDVIQWSLKSAQ